MKMYKSLPLALKERMEVRCLKLSIKGPHLPSELFEFPYLEELFLDGECTDLIFKTEFFPSLRVLSIKFPKFSGDTAPFFILPKLEILKILETPLKTLLLPLGNAAAPINSLTIRDCELTHLPEELGLLSSLKEMNLANNNLSALPASFVSLINLKRLNLDQNSFSLFPSVITSMKMISHLSIDQNPFSEDEKARIQREFHIWPN